MNKILLTILFIAYMNCRFSYAIDTNADEKYPKDLVSIDKSIPVVSGFNISTQPGQPVFVSGANFTNDLLFKVRVTNQNGESEFEYVRTENVSESLTSFTLPNNVSTSGNIYVWPVNNKIEGKPFILNKVEGKWLGPKKVGINNNISIYGNHLSNKLVLEIENIETKKSHYVAVSNSNPYKVTFKMPESSPPGEYHIKIKEDSNNDGESGKVFKLTLLNAKNDSKIINVVDYGAKGNDLLDDTRYIKKALAVAKENSPATIYLPSGTYMISDSVWLEDNVSIQGDGINQTYITNSAIYSASEHAMFRGNKSHGNNIKISDISFIGKPTGKNNILFFVRESENINFTNVSLSAHGDWSLDFNNSNLLSFENFHDTGASIFFGTAKQIFINNSIFTAFDNNELLTFWGGADVAITNNIINADKGSHEQAGRFIVVQGHWGASQNYYIARNNTVKFAPPPERKDQNSGEQILFEVPYILGSYDVISSTLSSVNLKINKKYKLKKHQMKCVVVSGNGVGQIRSVKNHKVEGNKIIIDIDSDWLIKPDKTSKINISPAIENVIIYKNNFQGLPDYRERITASVAINLYGNIHNSIIDSNTARDFRHMISMFIHYDDFGLSSQYWNQIENNNISNTINGISFHTVAQKPNKFSAIQEQSGFFGINVNDNKILNSLDDSIKLIYGNLSKGLKMRNSIHIFDNSYSSELISTSYNNSKSNQNFGFIKKNNNIKYFEKEMSN